MSHGDGGQEQSIYPCGAAARNEEEVKKEEKDEEWEEGEKEEKGEIGEKEEDEAAAGRKLRG